MVVAARLWLQVGVCASMALSAWVAIHQHACVYASLHSFVSTNIIFNGSMLPEGGSSPELVHTTQSMSTITDPGLACIICHMFSNKSYMPSPSSKDET